MSRRGGGSRGSFKSTKITVAHVEYITDIFPSQAFTMQIDQAVQPGLPFLFPWLNNLAKMFETYRIIKLVFFFKSTSADAVLSTVGPSGSTSLGSVIMMAQYNVLMNPPLNKREMLNNATAVSCKPSNSMSFTINPHAAYKTLFVRTPYTPTTGDDAGDRRLYDHCDFHLATEGMQASTGSIGELSVLAIMQFTKPTLGNTVEPVDFFRWEMSYGTTAGMPDLAGNTQNLMAFTQFTPASTLRPLPGSNIKGHLALNPENGIYTYYFGDTCDEMIGAIYEIKFTITIDYDGDIVAGVGAYPLISHAAVSGANCFYENCEHVHFFDDVGHTSAFDDDALLVTTYDITPSQGVDLPLYPNVVAYCYVKITGRDALFAVDTLTIPNNRIGIRWFRTDTGAPIIPGGTSVNHRLVKTMAVNLVSMPAN